MRDFVLAPRNLRDYRATVLVPVFVLFGLPVHAAAQIERPLYPLYEALAKSKVSASIEFSGSCEPNSPRFPTPDASTTLDGTALEKAREMFAGGPHMQVTAEASGTIRIKEPGVQDDLLNVKIRRIRIGGDTPGSAAYAPNLVLVPLTTAPEVKAFMRAHHIEWQPPLFFFSGSLTPPGFAFPHLSGTLENVTVAEVLDYVLRTFPGISLYKNCPAHNGDKRQVQVVLFKNPKMVFRRSTGWMVSPNPL